MLGSAAFPKQAGAVVNIGTGEIRMRSMEDEKVLRLERGASGLPMLDLTRDPLATPEECEGSGSHRLRGAPGE